MLLRNEGRPMADDYPLSRHLQSYIDTLDWEGKHDIPPEEREEAKKAENVVELIVDDIIASRETLTDNKLATIEKHFEETPDLIRDLLDERFTRDVVHAVPGYVTRLLELSRLEGSVIPSEVTNGYLREAVRTYVLGLPQACIALCRAALEQCLKENVGYRTRLPMHDSKEKFGLLTESQSAGVLDHQAREDSEYVVNQANIVLHEKPADLERAYQVLLKLRGVLQHVYAE